MHATLSRLLFVQNKKIKNKKHDFILFKSLKYSITFGAHWIHPKEITLLVSCLRIQPI